MDNIDHIARFEKARSDVGIRVDADVPSWCVIKDNRVFCWSPGAKLELVFVSLLEEQIVDVQTRLRTGLVGCGRPPELAESFPYSEIVALGLSSRSEKWVTLAVEWLAHVKLTDTLATALSQFIARKDGSQQARYRAQRKLRGNW